MAKKAQPYFRDYVRGGGKSNRKTQVSRIIGFLDWVESTEQVISLHGLGKRHVINFWKSHRHLSDATLHKYWLGICQLWLWLEKNEYPPEPHKTWNNNLELIGADKSMDTRFSRLSDAIKSARESHNYTIQQLANKSGLETHLIMNIESSDTEITLKDIQNLINILNIEFIIS
ncbi:MAG: helix-turn-helix domain-containing protein [Methylobacter sp.]